MDQKILKRTKSTKLQRIPRHEETATVAQESEGDLDICLDGKSRVGLLGRSIFSAGPEGGGSASVPATTTNVAPRRAWDRVPLPTTVVYRRIHYIRDYLLVVCRGLVFVSLSLV